MKLADRYRVFLALALVLGGLAIVGYGIWLVYEPAAWLFGGAALVAIGLLVELEPPKPKRPRRRSTS